MTQLLQDFIENSKISYQCFLDTGDCELDSFGKTVMVTDMHTRKQQMFEQVTFAFVWPHIKI